MIYVYTYGIDDKVIAVSKNMIIKKNQDEETRHATKATRSQFFMYIFFIG